ncbi:MAG: UDP-N-acetylmuramoyl-tripeptide--D-alanyl-D-alanine ligase, partial [Proteobacteria bacterium]|nr:UDP-N-acetylmuramoyl-tripeptide--D-alanyl-D-alanine ligase [Pseudomonadota bacterium]
MSARLGIDDVVRWSAGTLISGDAQRECRGVSIDSRRVDPGSLFIALRGPHHDAHGVLQDAATAG